VEMLGWSARRPAVKERDANGRATLLEMVEIPVEKDGLTATFRHEIWDGRPAGGTLRYGARDPWQDGGLTICLEGSGTGC
ncbi:MAG: hypothetical protein ACREQY_10410, partial [Candidatus Binatia bacterium]